MNLWKPKNGEKYYCVSVESIAYFHDDETAKPFLCTNSIKIMFKLWTANREDYERLLSLNVFATYKEAEKKLQEWQETIEKNGGFLNELRRSTIQ